MSYRVIFKPSAEKELAGLSSAMQRRVTDKLAQIERDPRGPSSVKLTGSNATYRVRVGSYRVVYEVDDVRQAVFVTIVAHRRDVYR